MGKGGASEATRRVGLCGRFLLSPPPPSRTPARMLSACTSPVLYDVLPDPARASRYDAIALNAGQRGPAGRGAVPGVPAPQSTSPCPRTALAASFASLSLTTPTAPQTRKSKRIDMVQPELPQELVDAIVDEIGDTLKGKARRLALAALVQTGWAFMRRAQLHQFHRIRLRGAERCAAWAAHFAETQRLGTYVHDLDVVGQGAAGKLDLSSWSEFPALLQACPNLDYLGMWRANVNRLPKPESFHRLVPSLRRLMLRDCFASYETLEGLLTTFPALQELKLGTMDMTGIHAPPAELPPLRLRRLTILSGLTIGGGGHAYGTRLGRSIGMLDELKMPFDYSEHFDFVRDLVQSLEEGPSTLRLTHSNRDSPPSASDISKMSLEHAKHLRCLQIGRIDLAAIEPTHWETHFIDALTAGPLEQVYLEYTVDKLDDVVRKPWDLLDGALGRARQPDLEEVCIVLHCAPGVDKRRCAAEVDKAFPLLRAREVMLTVL